MSVTVIICCYNGERYLRETLDSVLAQTVPASEVIVVDDGSTDSSATIAKSYGEPVRVIQHANRGLPASRNAAIDAARSEYLLFLDADDLMHPTSLERLFEALRGRSNTVAVMGFAAFRGTVDQTTTEQLFDFDEFFPEIIHGNFGPQHNRLIPKELVLRAGCFKPNTVMFEDWLFWCRVALCDARLSPVPFIGAYYRRHDSTMFHTNSAIARMQGHVQVMQELGQGMLRRPDLLERWGDQMFWSAWTALQRAREHQVPWHELRELRTVLRGLVRLGPPSVRQSRLAKSIGWLGVPMAASLRDMIGRVDKSIHESRDKDQVQPSKLAASAERD